MEIKKKNDGLQKLELNSAIFFVLLPYIKWLPRGHPNSKRGRKKKKIRKQ